MNRQERLEVFQGCPEIARSGNVWILNARELKFLRQTTAYSSISKLGAEKREGSSSRYFAKDSDTGIFVCLTTIGGTPTARSAARPPRADRQWLDDGSARARPTQPWEQARWKGASISRSLAFSGLVGGQILALTARRGRAFCSS